jgi:uncharacterized protein with GYD domain
LPHYLIEVGYTPDAWAAMVKNPQDRLSLVRPPIEKLGGRLETGYLTFGDYDLVCICEFPDNASAAAFALSVTSAGAVRSYRTTPLLTMDEGVTAMKKAGTSTYKPPSARAAARAAKATKRR